ASGEELLAIIQIIDSAALEKKLRRVSMTQAPRELIGGESLAIADAQVGAVRQQQLDDLRASPASNRVVQPRVLRAMRRLMIYIRAVLQIQAGALQVFEVELSSKTVGDVLGRRLGIEDQLEAAVVVVLGGVIERLHP